MNSIVQVENVLSHENNQENRFKKQWVCRNNKFLCLTLGKGVNLRIFLNLTLCETDSLCKALGSGGGDENNPYTKSTLKKPLFCTSLQYWLS